MSQKNTKVTTTAAPAVVPLLKRPSDLLFVIWYASFLFAVTFTDIHNFTASFLGVEVKDLEHRVLGEHPEGVEMVWPPKLLTEVYFAWAHKIDPLLYLNPIWWQVIEWINLLVLMPTSIIGIVAFARGLDWARNIMVITSSFTWYSLMLCIFCTLYGEHKSPNEFIFLVIYLPYAICPMCVIWRLWHDRPFTNPPKGLAHTLNVIVMLVTLVVYYYYCYVALDQLGYVKRWFVDGDFNARLVHGAEL